MNGGYIMIDCGGLNLLAESAQTIKGLYNRITEAYASGKPIFAYNMTYGENVPMSPAQVFGINEAGLYILSTSILQVRVTSEDSVTITSLVTDTNTKSKK